MKNIKNMVLTVCIMIICSAQAFAACDYLDKCPVAPVGLSSRAGQITSKYTGMTFLSEKIAQSIIKHELKKATKEKFKVEMKSFGVKDLAEGKFKSLKISGKNLDIEGVYLTSWEVNTLCDFNSVEFVKKSIKFRENMVMEFATEMSDTDLRKTMNSGGYLDKLNSVNLSSMGMTFFKLDGADVKIKNNKLYFTVKIRSQLFPAPISVAVVSDLKVEDGKIVMTKIDFVNLFTRIDLSKITYILNAINPLTFSMDILENKNTKMSIQKVDVIGDKIVIIGNILIPKNTIYAAKK